jgi:RNA polymerase sigma factor (sigma-70 family)
MEFDDRFDELVALAYRTAFRIVGQRGVAEEIAQDAMIKALVHWPKVQGHARPWVCRVAANEAIGVVRKNRPPSAYERPVDDLDAAASARLDLQRLLLALPRRQREVVVLRFVADLTETDVASELGLAIGTVKTHSRRGLESLRAALSSVPVEVTPDV